ncbi:nuclear transport receptor LGL2 [Thermoascus aurantiacus ATCC 26904]
MSAGLPALADDPQQLVADAKTLVAQLYDPANQRNPAKVKAIQEHLQLLQKSPHAWLIADALLSSDSTDARFFGALTFTVKINHDWSQLNEGEVRELLARLINYFVLLVNRGEKPLVIRKLASSLVAVFLKPNDFWTRPLRNLAVSLANGSHVPQEQSQVVDFQNAALPALNDAQIVALLYFSTTLAEEAVKWSSEARRSGHDHPLVQNIMDGFFLAEFVLRHLIQQEASGNPVSDEGPGAEAINSYNSWLNVRGAIPLAEPIPASQLASPTSCVIQSLRVPSLAKKASEVLSETLVTRESIFNPEHQSSILEYIVSDVGTAHVVALLQSDYDDEHMVFLDLLLAYSNLKQTDLLMGQLTPQHENVLTFLHTLFHGPGYAAVDDKACVYVLEWWTEAADNIQEMFMNTTDPSSLERAKQNLARVVLDSFAKLTYPDPETLKSWNDEDRSEFTSFRRDVCDFLSAVYPMLGVELVQVFQERAKSSLENQDWKTFEAAIFCLAELSEAVDENQHADECLNAIFFTPEFASLCAGKDMHTTPKARQTLVEMLGKYQSFFERTRALLPRVLTFLFASLNVPSCAPAASKSISHLCKSCRSALTAELPAFLTQFDQLRMNYSHTATGQTLERVLEGIAAIIQTLPADEDKAGCLERIVRFFHEQAQAARAEASRGEIETARDHGQLVLRCLASIGKGLRADGEAVVDLEGNLSDPYAPTFWNAGKGAVTQNMIMQCMQLLINDFPIDVTIVEAACDILKAGYTEKTGPYVFPPAMTVDFVKSIPLGAPGTDMVMGTASAFLASHGAHPERISNEVVALIIHVYETFRFIQNPQTGDPEIVHSGIDFLTRLLPKYHKILFSLTSPPPEPSGGETTGDQLPAVLPYLVHFTLLALHGRDPLPLRSASQFWTAFLNLAADTGRPDPDPDADPDKRHPVQDAIHECLAPLCHVLIHQIAGNCARSDLDHLSEVLKKVVFRHQGLARPYFHSALCSLDASVADQSRQLPPKAERERFLAMVLAARGSRQTNQLVRSFWLRCRGAGFEYTE